MAMYWECERQGCWIEEKKPDLSVFKECFSYPKFTNKITMGDVDGCLEVKGHFILLEWKSDGGSVGRGQSLMFERITQVDWITAVIVSGNPKTMEVRSFHIFSKGKHHFIKKGMAELKAFLTKWNINAHDSPENEQYLATKSK